MQPLLSIVSPVYKGENMLKELVSRIKTSVTPITENFEIILVNDASPDNSWEEITKACEADKRIKGLNLSRNFGQHYAITAGLHYAQGEWVVVMDCDLQDRPEEIPNLYQKAMEGYEIVYARKAHRQDRFLKRLSSSIFHSVYDWFSGIKTDKAIGNFGIYNSKVIAEYNKMKEVARAFNLCVLFLGFKSTFINVQHDKRRDGNSSYSLHKLLKLSFDSIISNSNKLLKISVSLGFILAFCSFILALYNVIAKLAGIIVVKGFTTTIFSIWFVGGVILSFMGIIGLYIGKIFDQVKERPLFVISDTINI